MKCIDFSMPYDSKLFRVVKYNKSFKISSDRDKNYSKWK